MRIATAVWRVSADLVLALDEHLGLPVDSYVNGSQTWFTGEPVLEWRLHPAAGFHQPGDGSPYDLWEHVVSALSAGSDAEAIALGGVTVALSDLWDALECFPAYGDELEPVALARQAATSLPVPPAVTGMVDHDVIGDEWERNAGSVSILGLLLAQLEG